MPDDPIAQLIVRAQEANISMASICREAGVATSTPSRWRAGADPKLNTVRKLSDALDALILKKAA
jgi:transcriptional regulator with XRE-family HTH domain